MIPNRRSLRPCTLPSLHLYPLPSPPYPDPQPQPQPKIYKSASITFRRSPPDTYPQYLLCREIRNGHLVFHPIGGKVEPTDRDILETACREFVEETRLLSIPKFQELFPEYAISKSAAIQWLYQAITTCDQSARCAAEAPRLTQEPAPAYYDYPVSKEKNYYHRFYIIDLDLVNHLPSIKEFLHNIGEFYKTIDPELAKEKDAGKISELVWDSWIASPRLKRSKYSALSLFLASLIHKSK